MSHLDATHVVRWSHITFDRPVPLISRRVVLAGDTIMSSHGFQLLVTEVTHHGDRGQTTELRGSAGTYQHVERSDSSTSVPLLARMGVTFGEPTYDNPWPTVPQVPTSADVEASLAP